MTKYVYDRAQGCMVNADTGEPTGTRGKPLPEGFGQRILVARDYAPYNCPITGRTIDGRREHNENLARHGVRVIEKGETRDAMRHRKEHQEQQLRKIDKTIERLASQAEVTE